MWHKAGECEPIYNVGGNARSKVTTRKTKTYVWYNVSMDLVDIGWDSVEWIDLAQGGAQEGLL
jgi:hypothetical protein